MLQKLKADRITAMKAKNTLAKSILSCLLSDAQTVAKTELRELTDNDVVESAKKLIKQNQSVIALGADNAPELKLENDVLKEFAPQQYTEAQLHSIIDVLIAKLPELVRGNGMIKSLMPLLKEHGDMLDKRAASDYIKAESVKIEAKKAEDKAKAEAEA